MSTVRPDRTIYGNASVGNATTYHGALNSAADSYVAFGFPGLFEQRYVVVGFPTPSELNDDYKWVRGEVRIDVRDNGGAAGEDVRVKLLQQPNFWAGGIGGTGAWLDTPGPLTSRYIMGPRSMFTDGQWYVSGWYGINANDLRFIGIDVVDPPTAGIGGPVGAVTVTDAGLPVQWTFVSPSFRPYVGWRLQICTNVDGTGVIYSASGASGTTRTVPAFVIAPYLSSTLYVRVSVAHDAGYGSTFLGPDPTTGTRQFSPYAQASFVPTGVITSTFQAGRPVAWVNELAETDRARLTLSHAPEFAAVLYQWDGQASWPLDLIAGTVSLDANQQIRGQCSLTVANGDLRPETAYPIDPTRPLHPFGSYIQLARGVAGKLVALGAFVIDEVTADLTNAGPSAVQVKGSDFARFLADARLTFAKTRQSVDGGGNYTPDLATKVMADVVLEAGMTSIVNGTSAAAVAPNYLTKRTDERPAILDHVCGSIGWWWYADTYGRIVFEPLPTPAAAPVYALVEGPTCTVIRQANTLSRANTYDLTVAYDDAGIYVAGAYDANPDSPIRRADGDPDTPTVGAGPFSPGGKPLFVPSPLIASLAAAEATARTALTRQAVPVDRITLDLVPLPDLRPGHVITVERTGEPVRTWIVDYVSIPLDETNRQTVSACAPVTFITAVAS